VGVYRTPIDTNRSAVRALGAAHKCPEFAGSDLGPRSPWTEGQELPHVLEPPG